MVRHQRREPRCHHAPQLGRLQVRVNQVKHHQIGHRQPASGAQPGALLGTLGRQALEAGQAGARVGFEAEEVRLGREGGG